jgi:hypothetical protein
MEKTTALDYRTDAGLAQALPRPGTVDVTIEILGVEIGDQIEASRLPWNSAIYDARNDVIELSVGGHDRRIPVALRHVVNHPKEVWLEEVDGLPRALLIVGADDSQTIVRFHERAALFAKAGKDRVTPA